MVARGVSTVVDTVLAVSLVTAAATALVVLAPGETTPAPPDAGSALSALAVTTATVNTSNGSVTASLGTHLAATATARRTPYAHSVRAAVADRLDALSGTAEVLVLRGGERVFAVGPEPPRTADVSAASLPVGNATLVLRRWWA